MYAVIYIPTRGLCKESTKINLGFKPILLSINRYDEFKFLYISGIEIY